MENTEQKTKDAKEARNIAEAKILAILQDLQKETGLFVGSIDHRKMEVRDMAGHVEDVYHCVILGFIF